MLLLTGAGETVVLPRNSQRLAERIAALGGRAEVRTYEGVGHMTIIGALSRLLAWKAPVLDDSVAFVRASGAS